MYKVLVVALKNSRLLLTILPDFSSSGKLLGKFQDFLKNSRLSMNPICSRDKLIQTNSHDLDVSLIMLPTER